MNPALFNDMQHLKSGEDYSFAKAIWPGVKHPAQKIGVFAGGRDSFTKYYALFDPIINEFHQTNSSVRFKGMTMHDILDSGACDFTGSMANPSKRWHCVDQSFIKSVRVTAIRNMDKMPTLAGLNKESAAALAAVQAKVIEGLQS